jgi:hypothetical protein
VERPPPPREVAVGPLVGGSCLYEEHIYFEQNIGARSNLYFGRHFAWLKYVTYHLVPALAPKYS